MRNEDIKKQAVIKIYGGLGNQLFQYFFSICLKSRFGVDVFLDDSFFDQSRKPHERLRLNDLNMEWSGIEKSRLSFPVLYSDKILKRLPFPRGFELVRERADLEWMHISKMERDTYFEGYWQSYKYLFDVDEKILTCLSSELDFRVQREARCSVSSISIHVRRGDYLASRNHSILSLDYYVEAIERIEKVVASPEFFVFSDDIEWVKKNLDLRDKSVTHVSSVSHNDDILDLALMKSCGHHIIANSTFSWWGAWLSWRELKGIVIAPKEWPNRRNSEDICPAEWWRI